MQRIPTQETALLPYTPVNVLGISYFKADSGDVNATNASAKQNPKETQDIDGDTALHRALRNNTKRNTIEHKIKLAKSSDPTITNNDGRTTLHLSVQHDVFLLITTLLVDKGAYLEARDKDGSTPLHFAAELGNIETVRLLLNKGANVNALGYLNRTPLMFAISTNQLETVQLLFAKNACIDTRDSTQLTALTLSTSLVASLEASLDDRKSAEAILEVVSKAQESLITQYRPN